MTRFCTLILVILSSVLMKTHADTLCVEADTLLDVNAASSINIHVRPTSTSFTIYGLDHTDQNFYYQTSSDIISPGNRTMTVNYQSLTHVCVTETNHSVRIGFVNNQGDRESYELEFGDNENRSVKTYVGERGSDFGFTISRSGKTKWDVISSGIGFGLTHPVSSNMPLHTSMGRSQEFTWLMMLGVKMTYRSNSVSLGLGIDRLNFQTNSNYFFHMEEDGKITALQHEEGVTKHSSSINIFRLQIPLLYEISFGRHRNFGFALGPVLNFNTGAHLKTKYHVGDEKYSITTHSIGQRKVTVDYMGIIRFKNFGIFGRYAPMSHFKKETGLDFQSFSVGVAIM